MVLEKELSMVTGFVPHFRSTLGLEPEQSSSRISPLKGWSMPLDFDSLMKIEVAPWIGMDMVVPRMEKDCLRLYTSWYGFFWVPAKKKNHLKKLVLKDSSI